MTREPDIETIQAAARRIAGQVHRTPVHTSRLLNQRLGAEVHVKCECFQRAGVFKFRGASNAVLSLAEDQAVRGVATHSSGNHGQALALAAQLRGIPAHVVMPSNAPAVKRAAVEGYGAQVVECEPTLKAREDTIEEVLGRTGATMVHPYDDPLVISGQGTAALELLEQVSGLDVIVTPLGGGGLLSGTALTVAALAPEIRVVGVEPVQADDAFRSLEAGELIPSVNPQTIADGLLTSLSDRTFSIIRRHVSEVVTVSEEAIVDAMRLVWERMKVLIEPSAAVPVAALLEERLEARGQRVGIIVTGGNLDLGSIPWLAPHDS